MKWKTTFLGTIITVLLSITTLSSQQNFSLADAIKYALEHHPSLTTSRLDGENAKWQYKEALSIGMPRINGNVDYSYFYKLPISPIQDFISPSIYGVLIQEQVTTENGVVTPSSIPEPQTFNVTFQQNHSLNLGLKGEVLLFDGNFLKGLKAAKLFIDLAEQQIQLTEQDIVQNVARAYQNVLITLKNVEIIDKNIANITLSLIEAQEIYDNGFIEQLDVDRLKLSLQNLQFERQKLAELIDVSYSILKYQMAYHINQEIEVTDVLETVVALMTLEINSIDQIVYESRPEHRLLTKAIELDYADLERIKQGYYPSVTGFAGYGQNLQRNSLFNGSETAFLPNGSVGLRARIPVYDGGYTKSKIQQKKIEIEKRQIELSEFDRAMTLQVISTETQYHNAQRSLVNAERSLELNENIYDKTQIKYKEGVGSSVEVTQAEASLYQAQANYINALYDLLSSKTELDIATGQILKTVK